MSKPAGNHKLALVFLRKDNSYPLTVGLTALAKIDSNVKYLTFEDANELCLRVSFLKMQTSQNALAGTRLIVLNKIVIKSGSLEIGLFVGLHKISAVISVGLDVNYVNTLYLSLIESKVSHYTHPLVYYLALGNLFQVCAVWGFSVLFGRLHKSVLIYPAVDKSYLFWS